jgi:hypothetical protein
MTSRSAKMIFIPYKIVAHPTRADIAHNVSPARYREPLACRNR